MKIVNFVTPRYPLHWHMADQLVAGASYVANNSIHHTMQVKKLPHYAICFNKWGFVVIPI